MCVCVCVCVQGLSELAVEQERDRCEKLLKELSEREAEKTERRMEEQHSRYVPNRPVYTYYMTHNLKLYSNVNKKTKSSVFYAPFT